MEKDTRNRLQTATRNARSLLEKELGEQLEGIYDIRLNGVIGSEPGPHLSSNERLIRSKLVAAVEHHLGGGRDHKGAVLAYRREAAFTALNRFVALKMLEARQLVQECVSRGDQSSGFREFIGLAPGLVDLPDGGYRLYLECLFDELGREVRVLFDRRDPASLLWPRRQAITDLLAMLNAAELADVWGEDEAIGWVYQYFNGEDERRQMRAESLVPRDSRELAVRNQFFTPRYVVQFLTDNTLGRMWYEMRGGKTALIEQCELLVRRANEVFLAPGKQPPRDRETLDTPTYVRYRAPKDPRDLKILDPACGSGHFLLYAFGLLQTIYEEAWADEYSPASTITDTHLTLRDDYPDRDTLRRSIPELILRHNLWGVDIDARCAQIAALALWMRAQRAYHETDVPRSSRPQIKKTHIVVAEPMPGEPSMRAEFLASMPDRKQRTLMERVFAHLELAGEAGLLIKIEKAIDDAIRTVYGLNKLPGHMFAEEDRENWERIEAELLDALQLYSAQAQDRDRYRRRLFAEDAERGFAFVDLSRQRYDVVLMNPPFGESSAATVGYLQAAYPTWNQNLLCAFIEMGWSINTSDGATGVIFDRTATVKSTYEPFRRSMLIPDDRIALATDLGWEVLDANVELMMCVLSKVPCIAGGLFFDVRDAPPINKGRDLSFMVRQNIESPSNDHISIEQSSTFSRLPNAVIGYDFPSFLRHAFMQLPSLEASGFKANQGFALKADRFFRTWWELELRTTSRIDRMFNGAGFSPYYTALVDCSVSRVDPEDLPIDSSTRKSGLGSHRLPGVCFGKRGEYFCAHILPAGHIFTVEGQAIPVADPESALDLIAYLNTVTVRFALNKYCGQHKYSGYVNLLPFARIQRTAEARSRVAHCIEAIQLAQQRDETQSAFCAVPIRQSIGEIGAHVTGLLKTARSAADACEVFCDAELAKQLAITQRETAAMERFRRRQPEKELAIEDADIRDSCVRYAAHSVLSYAVGVLLGRWDIRIATGEKSTPALPDPFAPLPACPPGQLQDEHGLPLTENEMQRLTTLESWGYPVEILWDGILTDDSGHLRDIEARVALVLQALWNETWDDVQQQLCEELGVRSLRDYFRRPDGFFADHIARYSKSRRKAPIYWQLATPSGSYSVWLYIHRATPDTLYTILNDYASPKLQHEERRLSGLIREAGPTPSPNYRRDIADQEAVVGELRELCKEIARVAPLWAPDLNDGLIINFAPLWRLVPQNRTWQKEVQACWDALCTGTHDWSHLAMRLWPERVVPKCADERSLAIAHDLESEFWVEGTSGKWRKRENISDTISRLVAERTSPAVKAALTDLLTAPVATAGRAGARKAKVSR